MNCCDAHMWNLIHFHTSIKYHSSKLKTIISAKFFLKSSCRKPFTEKNRQSLVIAGFPHYGAAGEIRTLGRRLTVTRFPIVLVMTASILLQICRAPKSALLFYPTKRALSRPSDRKMQVRRRITTAAVIGNLPYGSRTAKNNPAQSSNAAAMISAASQISL